MIEPNFNEFFYYFSITCLIFLLFFLFLTIFGYILLNIISKKILKISEKISFMNEIFLCFGIGTSFYITLSFIPIVLKIFNFYFAYLPILIIDGSYLLYKVIKRRITFKEIKNILNFFSKKIKLNRQKFILFCFTIIILFLLQINLQWTLFIKAKSLISKDTYHYIKNIYYILDQDTINYLDIGIIYPPGFIIFCSGALQIYNDYIIAYYFLKFGGFFFLSLFILNIYQIVFKSFKKLYLAFLCSLLLLSFYLYIARLNAFLPSSIATFFLGISLKIFILDKKYLYLLGIFVPLIFFLHPFVLLYYFILIFSYFISYLIYFDRKKYKEYLKIILFCISIIFLSFIPYYLYILYIETDILSIFNHLFGTIYKTNSCIKKDSIIDNLRNISKALINPRFNSLSFNSTPLIENIIDFLINPNITIAFITVLMLIFLLLLGFLSKSPDEKVKNLNILCKLSIFIIVFSYIIVISFLSSFDFFKNFQDRILLIYCPIIIILCGFGINSLERIFKKLITFLNQKFITKKKILGDNKINKNLFKLENIFKILLIISLISIHLAQYELIDEFASYHYNDDAIDSYLFLRKKAPENSTILTPEFSFNIISWILYDMEIIISPFNTDTSFNEFNNYIIKNEVNYLLLDKSVINIDILLNIFNSINYHFLMENSNYYIFEVSAINGKD